MPRLSAAIAAALTIATASLIAGCDRSNAASGPPRPVPDVEIATAVPGDVPLYIDEIGKTTAREFVNIQPEVSGQIKSIDFTDGADLHKGQILFTIDPRPYQATLDQAKASLAANEAQLHLAQDDWKRYQSLDPRSVSASDFDAKKNAVFIDQANVEQSQAAIESAQVNLDYCTIRSPIDGRAGQRLIDLGNVVIANSSNWLVSIQRLDPIYADFTVTENDLARVRQYMAKGTLRVVVHTPAQPDVDHEGELTFFDNAVQDGTGTVKLRATLPNPKHELWPGQFVNVRLILQQIKDAVLVPQTAIQISATGPYIYVVNDKELAELRPVQLGQHQANDTVVIESGVAAGDRVVTAGQPMVIPGSPVNIKQPTTQPAGVATAPASRPS